MVQYQSQVPGTTPPLSSTETTSKEVACEEHRVEKRLLPFNKLALRSKRQVLNIEVQEANITIKQLELPKMEVLIVVNFLIMFTNLNQSYRYLVIQIFLHCVQLSLIVLRSLELLFVRVFKFCLI